MAVSRRGVPAKKENIITGADGEEYTQRHLDINADVPVNRTPGPRIRVYNKLRARLHCSDCILDAQADGSIAKSDLEFPGIRNNVIEVK